MPSKEEKNVNENGQQVISGESQSYDIDAVTELSEEEIERLLAEGAGTSLEDSPAGNERQEDVLEMLEDADDDDLWDIQDMLKKSDRNEAIEPNESEQEKPVENPAEKLLEDIEGTEVKEEAEDPKARKALEKQRRAEEKKRLKEEKAAKKKAAKAEKAAKRQHKGQDIEEAEEPEEQKQDEIQEYDMLLDKELLDSIVSDAGNLGREEKSGSPQEGSFSLNELGSDFDAARDKEHNSESEGTKVENVEPEKEEAVEDGIVEVDMNEIDNLIPDIDIAVKEEPEKNKKGGLMTKIISMLMEEEEEPENEDIPLSEENQEIIKDLDNEEKGEGKGKKGKKAKKAAKKPAKKKEKKKKPPKPAKPPKAKKAKEPEPYTGKKITFKKALPVILLGATVGAVTFIFVNLATDFSVKQEAAEAYRNGDYAACYENLYGKSLNDEQAQMYGKSESILYMEQMYHKYDLIVSRGTEAEALDSLIQTVNEYPQIYEYAAQWEALPEVGEVYSRILAVLAEKYHLTEEQAKEIAAIKSNIEYTRVVTAVAEGNQYASWDAPGSQQMPTEPDVAPEDAPEDVPESQPEEGDALLPDELPEESELGNESFADNQ